MFAIWAHPKWQAVINADRELPMMPEELGSAHHMEEEEGRGEEQLLVHLLPLSHVSLAGALTLFLGGKRRMTEDVCDGPSYLCKKRKKDILDHGMLNMTFPSAQSGWEIGEKVQRREKWLHSCEATGHLYPQTRRGTGLSSASVSCVVSQRAGPASEQNASL